jgi:nicotinamidase/pyrazinamidase
MKALLLIDLQNDFDNFGVLQIKGTAKMLATAKQLVKSGYFDCIVASQYAHPANHKSFAANHFFRYPNQSVAIEGVEQRLWSIHCVEGSFGAEFMNDFDASTIDKTIQRAIDITRPSYSCFNHKNIEEAELTKYLQQQKVEEVFFLGVNTEYGISDSALDAQKLGFKTFLLEDACLAANLDTQEDGQKAILKLQEAGVLLLDSDQLVL